MKIVAKDGFELSATLFDGGTSRVLVIQSATAIKRSYYNAFAQYVASRGISVVTYDYRGVGESVPRTGLRGFEAKMSDWARLDADSVLLWAKERFPQAQIFAVGHSFGGQAFALMRNTGLIAKAVLVASQSGYWRLFRARHRLNYAFLWYVLMPILTRVYGYFPSKWVGLGEELPRGVALQWSRWCRTPGYFEAELEHSETVGFRALQGPVLFYEIWDDPFAPPRAAHALAQMIRPERLARRRIKPRQMNVRRIGHFGFFRARFRETLWKDLVDWLLLDW